MHHRQVLRAGTAGAIGVSLCFCFSAQGASGQTTHAARDGKRQEHKDNSRFDGALKLTNERPHHVKKTAALGLDTSKITPWRQITVQPGDSLSRVFARADLGASEWMGLLALKDKTRALNTLRPGDKLEIRKTVDGRLAELRFDINALDTLMVNRDGDKLVAHIQKVPTENREITVSGTIGHSLARSLSQQGVPSGVAAQLSSIYKYRRNLRSLHPGDHFAIVYSAEYAGVHEVSTGPVLAASITTGHQNYKAFRAKDAAGDYDYFDSTGQSYKPTFTRKPVAYTRISSPFNLHRMNPVLHVVRPHKGVDMAAPMGTPIHAAANGTVKYAGWMHGYGRLVELDNFSGYSTRYGHMHRLAKGMHVGDRVHKGEIIGYVGESGEATGPHLHFEVRRYGVAYNPMTVKLPGGQPLPASQLARYTRRIKPLVAMLEPVPNTLLARSSTSPTRNSCTQRVSFNATLALDPIGAARRHETSNIFCIARSQPTSA